MKQHSSSTLEKHPETHLVEDQDQFYNMLKSSLPELMDLKVSGFETYRTCIEQHLPLSWRGTELGHFLCDLKNRHFILLKPTYHAKKTHRLKVYECIQRVLITLNDIFRVKGHEHSLYEEFRSELETEITTLESLRTRFTYTNGDKSFGDLLDQIEEVSHQYENSIEQDEKQNSHHNELQQLKKIIAAENHSLYADHEFLKSKLEHANDREMFLHRRCSQASQHYTTLLENLLNNLIEYKIEPAHGLSRELEAFINEGHLSRELLNCCGKKSQNDYEPLSNKLSIKPKKETFQHVVFTQMSDWLSIELQNALETPFRKAIYQTLIFYYQLTRRLLTNLEYQEIHLNENLDELHNSTDLRQQMTTLRKIIFFTTAYEQALGKGRSVSSAQKIRDYTKLSALQKNKYIELQERFESLGQVQLFKKHHLSLTKNLKQLMITRYQLKNLLIKVEKYLEQKFPQLQHRATDSYEPQSIIYRLRQLLLEAKHSIESKGSEATFLPLLKPGEANVDLNKLSEGISKLEKYFPIFKRPLGSLKQAEPERISLENWLTSGNELSLEKQLIELEDQLRTYQLKSRETRILLLPTEGQGSYDPYTNTILVPQISKGDKPLEGLYHAIATYLYRSKIQNDSAAYKDLVDVLSQRHKNVKKRQHCERIIINAFGKHLMEVTGLIHTSGHTQKEKKVISSHLDHPNHLIQCREIINISVEKREDRLDAIMSTLGLSKLENIGMQIIHSFEDPDLSDINSELSQDERLNSIFEHFDAEKRIYLTEKIFDLGVIQFHKHHLSSSLECFLILRVLSPESQEVWWNIATILNYHPFDGYVELVRDRKKTALNAYKNFCQTPGVSEYWIKKARSLSQELELKQF